jgi:transcriptional regulator with XRE-family HTH domain
VQGLRREELAGLAGLSADYYARLEQGRHSRPSPGILDAVADVLRLSPAERDYLQHLAQPAEKPTRGQAVRPETLKVMWALGSTPAVLVGPGSADDRAWRDVMGRTADPAVTAITDMTG